MTANVFKIHISGLYFIALSRIIAPAFFSLEDSKTPALLGVISVGIGIIFMKILAPVFKANGIATATIISSIVLTILYFIFLSKKDNIDFKEIIGRTIPIFFRITIYSFISAIPLYFFKNKIFSFVSVGNKIVDIGVPLIITTILYFAVYIFILLITKEKAIKTLKGLARK